MWKGRERVGGGAGGIVWDDVVGYDMVGYGTYDMVWKGGVGGGVSWLSDSN